MSRRKQDAAFAAVLTVIAAGLCVRALYGFCWSDESFYLTFAQRLWNGQKLILDEWHPVQFYSALTYPILTIYRFFFGTGGIYLFARILYLALAYGVSLLVYVTFRTQAKPVPSFLCACMVLAYSRGNIWGLSYYNLFFLLTLTALCLWVTGRGRRGRLVLCGVSLGFSVLCVPYFAIFVLAALAYRAVKKESRGDALWVFAGICLSAAYFLIFFLPKDLGAVLTNLRFLLSDPEHAGGVVSNFTGALSEAAQIYKKDILLALLIAALLWAVKKWFPDKTWASLAVCCLALVGGLYSFWHCRHGETGFAAYSFCMFGLALFRQESSSQMDFLLRKTGAAMGLAMAMSSNTGATGFTVGLCVYAMGLLLPLARREDGVRLVSLFLACVMTGMTLFSHFADVFRDAPLEELDTVITQGPAAGIHTTQDHARQYTEVFSMLEDLEGRYGSDTPIFISKLLPWGYLAVDNPCGAPTAWRTALDSPRLQQYYESHPRSIPGIVVVLNPEIGYFDTELTPNENFPEGWLWDYMAEENYTCTQYPPARVYISPDVSEKGANQ